MPTAPYVVAAATSTFAESVSNDTDRRRAWSIARGGRTRVEVTSAATTAMGTDAARAAVTAHAALSSGPASMPTKNNPKPSAANTARPAPAAIAAPSIGATAPVTGRRSQERRVRRRATAAPLGTSPRDASTASGTTGAAAEMGATIPIAPIAKPR